MNFYTFTNCGKPKHIITWNRTATFRKGVIKGLKYLIKKNFYIFIITNQAGIAKGKFKEKDFFNLHKYLKQYLSKKNILFDEGFGKTNILFNSSKFRVDEIILVSIGLFKSGDGNGLSVKIFQSQGSNPMDILTSVTFIESPDI